MTIPLVSVADVMAQLNLTNMDGISDHLLVATELIEAYVGPVTPSSFTETLETRPVIVLSRAPVVSLDAMVAVYPNDAYFGYVYDVANYHVDNAKGILRRIPQYGYAGNFGGVSFASSGFTGLVTITYTAGRVEIPWAIQQAAIMFVQEMLGEQRGAAPLPALGGPQVTSSDSGRLPPDIAEMLAPFRRAARIA